MKKTRRKETYICIRCNQNYKPTILRQRLCNACRTRCSSCNNPLSHKDQIKSNSKLFTCVSCRVKARKAFPERLSKKRSYNLMYNFGISMDEYNNLLKEQNGVCFICQRPPKNRALNVDHKHEKNESKRAASNKRLSIRGLLCYSCNKGLSYFKDNPSLLEQAAKYLKRGFRFK